MYARTTSMKAKAAAVVDKVLHALTNNSPVDPINSA